MTIPYLPGIGDTLAQFGPQLGQNLSKILQPNKEKEQMLQKLLANNPDAINQFVELERTNPGITANMFGPKGQQFIAGSDFTPSFKRRQEAEDIQLETGKVSLKSAKGKLAEEEAGRSAFQTLIDNTTDPQFRSFAVAKRFNIATPEEYASTIVNSRLNQLKLTDAQRAEEDVEKIRNLSALTDVQINDLVKGKLPPETYRLLFSDPGLSKVYGELINTYQQSRRDAAAQQRTEAAADRREAAAQARLIVAHEQERTRLMNQRGKLLEGLQKRGQRLTKDDGRIAQINQLGTLLAAEYDMPLELWGVHDPFGPGGPKLVKLDPFTGERIPFNSNEFIVQSPEFQQQLQAYISAPPEKQKSFEELLAESDPELLQLIKRHALGQQAILGRQLAPSDVSRVRP
jgi:hypothetical protein